MYNYRSKITTTKIQYPEYFLQCVSFASLKNSNHVQVIEYGLIITELLEELTVSSRIFFVCCGCNQQIRIDQDYRERNSMRALCLPSSVLQRS